MSSLYLEKYKLIEEPFRLTPDPRYFFSGEQYERVLMELRYGIDQRKGFMILTGEVGTGKTTVCRTLMDSLDPGVRTALILNPSLTVEELLFTVVQDFGLPMPSLVPTKKELLDALNRFLLEAALAGGGAVLIVDEAQNLTGELLEELRLLTNLETDREKLLQIILIGQPELSEKLASKELRQLRQRVAVWARLEPLDRAETGAYIVRRISVASGGTPSVRFAPDAIRRIHRHGSGIPRTINLLCDRALMLAYLTESDAVTGRMITRAAREVMHSGSLKRPYRRNAAVTAAAALLAVALVPSGMEYVRKSAPVPVTATVEASIHIQERSIQDLLSRHLMSQGYDLLGKEILPWAITSAGIREIDTSLRSYDISGKYGIRSAVIPLDHPLWLRSGSMGIVRSSDGSLVLVEPQWGKGREWRVIDRIEGNMGGRKSPSWDVGLVFFRALGGLEIPLGRGDKGGSVTSLQTALSRMDVLKVSEIDGIYGVRTARAVESLQKQWFLDPTGSLDDGTAYYMTKFLEIRD